ncbi:MAG: metal-dependent hydrolase [Idiomarina sp.]|nr:metal-dependent hydrolase [Idiomarina sp.]
MDPVAHALSGSAMAAAGLRRVTPLATAALLIGVMVPDIDGLILFDEYAALAHRRGLTHGIAAVVVLPLLVTSLLLLWDRWVRRRRNPDARPAQAGQLFLLTALGVSLHLFFDWLNNYGVRLLMPFDDRWFYGDALFIIDPWLWLMLGGITFLTWSTRPVALVAWAILAIVLSLPMFLSDLVAPFARVLWLLALGALVVIRLRWPPEQMGSQRVTRITRIVLLVAAAYVGANIAGATAAREQVRAIALEQGIEVIDVMVGPVAVNPLRGSVIVQTDDAYFMGQWNWLGSPPLELEQTALPSLMQDPRAQRAATTAEAQNFLSWSRYPYALVEVGDNGGYIVHFYDVRFADFDDAISGPSVELNQELEVISVE